MADDASAKGKLVEFVLVAGLVEAAAGLKLADLPPFSAIADAGWVDSSTIGATMSTHYTLPLPEQTLTLLPHMMGPDAGLFAKPLLLLFADKTTNRKGRSVDKRDTWKNFCTTDICSVWSGSREPRRAFRKYICDKARTGELKGIIRIHNVFPSASRETRSFFNPGCTTFCERIYDLSEKPVDQNEDNTDMDDAQDAVAFDGKDEGPPKEEKKGAREKEKKKEDKGKEREEEKPEEGKEEEPSQVVTLWETIVDIDLQTAPVSRLMPSSVLDVLYQIYHLQPSRQKKAKAWKCYEEECSQRHMMDKPEEGQVNSKDQHRQGKGTRKGQPKSQTQQTVMGGAPKRKREQESHTETETRGDDKNVSKDEEDYHKAQRKKRKKGGKQN